MFEWIRRLMGRTGPAPEELEEMGIVGRSLAHRDVFDAFDDPGSSDFDPVMFRSVWTDGSFARVALEGGGILSGWLGPDPEDAEMLRLDGWAEDDESACMTRYSVRLEVHEIVRVRQLLWPLTYRDALGDTHEMDRGFMQ